MNQDLIEALYSPANRRTVLKQAILFEFNHRLEAWALRSHMQLELYLQGSYYASKKKRVDELRLYFLNVCSADNVLAELFMAIIRRGTNPTFQAVIGHLLPFMPHENKADNLLTAGELVALCSNDSPYGFYDVQRPDKLESPIINVKHWEAVQRIFGDQLEWIDDTFFNPPLIEEPKEVKDNHSCGYHTVKEPLILGEHTMHDFNLDYQTVNTLNQIQWVLDKGVLSESEPPPNELYTFEDKLNFMNHMKQAKKIYQLLQDRPFYLAWQYDSRGRLYSHGHHVNLQSHEYKKALLNFNDFQHLTR